MSRPRLRSRWLAAAAILAVGATAITVSRPASAEQALDLQVEHTRRSDLVRLVDHDQATFSGLAFDDTTRVVTVQYPARAAKRTVAARLGTVAARPRTAAAKPAAAKGAAAPWRLSMKPVRYSRAELEVVRQRFLTDDQWRRPAGTPLSQLYIEPERNVVVVGVSEVTPALRDAVAGTFGDMVAVEAVPRAERVSRLADIPPYIGGIRLQTPTAQCTSGFVIALDSNPNTRRMLTAGHCVQLADNVYNNGNYVGTVADRQFANNGLDAAWLTGAFEPLTYVGPVVTKDFRSVAGEQVTISGDMFCISGSVTGERCTGKVTGIDMCMDLGDGIMTCHLDRLTPVDFQPLVQRGDSGAPVYAYGNDARVWMAGMIVGREPTVGSNAVYYHPYGYLIPPGWHLAAY